MATIMHTPEGDHAEPTREEARQGQNIHGMVAVLIVSTLLVVAAYGVLLAVFGGGEARSDRSPAADLTTESSATVTPGARIPSVTP